MNMLPDHWIDTAKREPIAGGSRMDLRRYLIIHATCGASGESSIQSWKDGGGGVCAHFVIERDGTLIQCRPCNRTSGHAGKSLWHDHRDLNSCSIGIELANAGSDDGALSWARKQPGFFSVKARHKNGGPVCEWEGYQPIQLRTLEILAKVLVERYNLDDVIGHDDVAPDRRDDPGPAFPMDVLRAVCGFKTPIS